MKLSVAVLILLQGSFVSPQYYDIKKTCTDRGVCNNNHALNSSQCEACYREYEVYNDMYNKAKNLKPGDAGFAPTSVSMQAGIPTPPSVGPVAAQAGVSVPTLQANPLSLPTATAAVAPIPLAASVTPAAPAPTPQLPGLPGIPNPAAVTPALPAHINTAPSTLQTTAPAAVVNTASIAAGSQSGTKLSGQPTSVIASATQTDSLTATLLPTSTPATDSNSTAPSSSETASSSSKRGAELTAVLSITTTLVLIGIAIGL